MILIAGLGNIGRAYKDTPHNAGFEFVNALRTELKEKGYVVDEWKNETSFLAQICKIRENGDIKYMLVKPTTYMNLSGNSVSKIIEKFNPKKVVIAHDDLDIHLGEYKIQEGKGPKDHNGIKSISTIKGSDKFLRVRLGVEDRKDRSLISGEIYVIRKLSPSQTYSLDMEIKQSIAELLNLV